MVIYPKDEKYEKQLNEDTEKLSKRTHTCQLCKKEKLLLEERMKFNLGVRTPEIFERPFHKDYHDVLPENVPYKVAIFYLNTNNGYTLFESGDKVESVANRKVIFDGKLKHCGTTCTDSKTRVVLNINYI